MALDDALRDQLHKLARSLDNNDGRPLEQLIGSNELLRGVESQRLRTFCTSEYMSPDRDLDEYGWTLFSGQRLSVEQDFIARVGKQLHSPDSIPESEAVKKVCESLCTLRWGPTRVPIFNLLGLFRIIEPDRKGLYIDIARFLVDKGVPVNGTDLSGTTALFHSFSTKPGFDFEYAQLLYDAGGDVNQRNRYGATVAHEITQVYRLSDPEAKIMAVQSLEWFLSHGGNVDIADSDGMVPRLMADQLRRIVPGLSVAVSKEDRRRKAIEDSCCSLCGLQNPKLLLCSRCKRAKYCPRDQKQCQKLDWPKHKKSCVVPGH